MLSAITFRNIIVVVSLILVGIAISCTIATESESATQPEEVQGASPRGKPIAQPFRPSEIELVDQHNQPFKFSDHLGHPVLMFFGYTRCPDFCPFTLSTWVQVQEGLGEDANNVRYVFITLDPERDDKPTLKRHLGHFSEDFIGLTGSRDNLEMLYDDFDVYYQKVGDTGTAVGYLMSHSVFIYLLDEDGYARAEYSFQDGPEAMINDIRDVTAASLGVAR